jgi:hypothetical protein
MDIKKEFEPTLKTKKVQRFFQELLSENQELHRFANLQELIEALNDRTKANYQLKDSYLRAMVVKIQKSVDKEAGLSLLTYVLAPGLQVILRDNFRVGRNLREIWSDLWWSFCQVIEGFSAVDHPQQVAEIILRKTIVRYERNRKKIEQTQVELITIEDYISTISEIETAKYLPEFFGLQDFAKEAGISALDLKIIVGSRTYGESLDILSQRLGMSYSALQKRRKRAEQKLKKYFSKQ